MIGLAERDQGMTETMVTIPLFPQSKDIGPLPKLDIADL